MKLTDLSDAQLLESLKTVCGQGRVVLARLLAHLIEVEERRLHLEAACPSMFQFCVRRLGMSEDEAQALLAARSPSPDVPAAITTIPVQPAISTLGAAPVSSPAPAAGPQLAPLSETRHRVQFTASDDLRNKLERAQDLLRHANADGDLAAVVERAVDQLLAKLEKRRFGKAARPRQAREQGALAEARAQVAVETSVPRATRRAVFERDGERCTFTDADGNRCPASTWLELDHVVARARGGTSEPGNLRVRCRAHNRLHAEQTFGKEHVERKIRERRHPRQRGSSSESFELAASGLVKMGFRRADVRRALDVVSARHRSEALETTPVQTILREALAVLT